MSIVRSTPPTAPPKQICDDDDVDENKDDDAKCPHQTRVLKSDFARYNLGEDDDSEDLDQDDNGWKIIQTDVFRFPPAKNLFCAILGKSLLHSVVGTGWLISWLVGWLVLPNFLLCPANCTVLGF